MCGCLVIGTPAPLSSLDFTAFTDRNPATAHLFSTLAALSSFPLWKTWKGGTPPPTSAQLVSFLVAPKLLLWQESILRLVWSCIVRFVSQSATAILGTLFNYLVWKSLDLLLWHIKSWEHFCNFYTQRGDILISRLHAKIIASVNLPAVVKMKETGFYRL